MEFYTPNGMTRPIRLCDNTRRFAYESLNHKYGLDTKKTYAVTLDHIGKDVFDKMTPLEKHDAAITEIVTKSPVRICDGELISGAATLGLAIGHRLPATYNGEIFCGSISHLTIDFETVVKFGLDHIREKAEASLRKYKGTEREPFAQSCVHVLDCFDIWHRRYLDALQGRTEYEANYKNLSRVPHKSPTSFHEAVQSIWFVFAFTRLCGNWPGIGRIDYLLGEYLENDLKNGVLTIDEAREILAHFFIKGCEWVAGGNYGSGDAQHYQNILLSGVDENGNEVTNAVTYLVLDILEELGISDFPTTVRLNKGSDEKLIRRVAEVMRYGGGMLAVYNEDLIIESLTDYGYPLPEARKFANDGCWEVQIPGRTFFSYRPFDSLQILQKDVLKSYESPLDYPDFESLYREFLVGIRNAVAYRVNQAAARCSEYDSDKKEWIWIKSDPCTVVSLFEGGCIESGRPYNAGGAIYNVTSPHIGGLGDTANSLYVIKKLVYEEKRLTLDEFMNILKSNWEGNETLMHYIRNKYTLYGNDNDEVDGIAARILNDFADICDSFNGVCAYKIPAGVSTFGRQLEWSNTRLASPHGRKIGDILAGNCSPTPGTDREGATAIIRSYCKANLKRQVTGAALDIRLLPSSVRGEDGLDALIALMRGFVALGGHFMQIDVADAAVLREAREHPEDYQTLSVRVSGWNARFVTLNECWQQMIIEQNEK